MFMNFLSLTSAELCNCHYVNLMRQILHIDLIKQIMFQNKKYHDFEITTLSHLKKYKGLN